MNVPLKFIDQQLKQHGNLYPAYLAIQQAEQTYNSNNARIYQRLTKPRKCISATDMSSAVPIGYGMDEFRKELQAARAKRQKDEGELLLLLLLLVSLPCVLYFTSFYLATATPVVVLCTLNQN